MTVIKYSTAKHVDRKFAKLARTSLVEKSVRSGIEEGLDLNKAFEKNNRH